jgi:predicted nucleotidyltransferase
MSKENIVTAISQVANTGIPKGARVILFGSQARGDAKEGSDWDVLVLIDKERLSPSDHDLYSYPFWELGWKIDAMIHPAVYTLNNWKTKANPIFRTNVERDGIEITYGDRNVV